MTKLRYISPLLVLFTVPVFAADAVSTTPEALATTYRGYYEQKNCDGMMSLVYQEGLSPEIIAAMKNALCDFSKPVENVAAEGPKPQFTQPDASGKLPETTLPVAGNLEVKFAKQGEQFQMSSRGFPIGQKDGRYYIVVKKPAAVKP